MVQIPFLEAESQKSHTPGRRERFGSTSMPSTPEIQFPADEIRPKRRRRFGSTGIPSTPEIQFPADQTQDVLDLPVKIPFRSR